MSSTTRRFGGPSTRPGTISARRRRRSPWYQLVVTNESDQDCSFYLGALVRDLEVAPGEKAQTDVQIPPTNGEDNQVDMGCLGDDTRQGTVIIRNATGSSLGVD